MLRRTILLLSPIVVLATGCAGPQRTAPYVELAKDYFGTGLPKEDRRFVDIAGTVDTTTSKTVYLRVTTPPGIGTESRLLYVATIKDALRQLGVRRLLDAGDIQAPLEQRGVKFSFDREPDPSEWPIAESDLGPFIALHFEYGFSYGSRRYIRIQARHSSSAQILLDASYDAIISNDTSRELIYPAMNIYANGVNGQLRLRPAN